MSKRTDFNNGGFVVPSPVESELKTLVQSLQDTLLKLGELLLTSTPPNSP